MWRADRELWRFDPLSLTGEAQPRDRHHHAGGGNGHQVERGFTAAFELVATPALFGFFGWLLDNRLGTTPLFTIVFAAVVTFYVVWKLWYTYNAEMDRLEERASRPRPHRPPGDRRVRAESTTGPALQAHGPEREVALDMARIGLLVAPAFLALSALIWGFGGLLSSALAFTIVVVNLLLGAWIIGQTASISPNLLMGGVLGGFILRLLIMSVVVVPIRDLDWFEVIPFAVTLVGGHLGLLAWETQRVSISLAYPGLAPDRSTRAASVRGSAAPAQSTTRPRSDSDR